MAKVPMPAGWVAAARTITKKYGTARFEALVAELQQDADGLRVRAVLEGIPRRSEDEQRLIAIALGLGANLILHLDEWLNEAPDDPQVARRTPRGEN